MGREWGGMEVGRSVYEQPGTRVDGILSQQGGFQVSKRVRRGKAKSKGLRYNFVVHIYMYIIIACN
jgi:hypothetical protein